ncbi:glycosyltransferase, partial [Coleofasciculus sp. LEGE 07081]|nr:glycosyltransferase [Coleofasciculus sp. LEGE 07081]
MPFSPWICCQLGAREHYAIPRALHKAGQLAHLITDAWVLPQSPLNLLPTPLLANLRDRFHPDLTQASVHAFTASLIRFELAKRIQKTLGWERLIARNCWFQQQAVQTLETVTPQLN